MTITTKELKKILSEEKILIVHFSGPTSKHTFPENFNYYIDGCFPGPLSCSAFRPNNEQDFIGDIGLILCPSTIDNIISVSHIDSGSINHNDQEQSNGVSPTSEAIFDSINHTPPGRYNEWRLQNAKVVGLFIKNRNTIRVRKKVTRTINDEYHEFSGDVQIELSEVFNAFPNLKIFTYNTDNTGYEEISRENF